MINKAPFQSGYYINYDVTHDELHKVYKYHPQNKSLTDGQRANITGETEAEAQTLDSGETGTVQTEHERGGQANIGENEEGYLSKNTISDESKRQGTNIHGDQVSLDDGESAVSDAGTSQDQETADDRLSESNGSTEAGRTTETEQGSAGLADRGNGYDLSVTSRGDGSGQGESDNGKPFQSDSGSNNALGEEDHNHFMPRKM